METRAHPFPVESYLVRIDVDGAPLEGQLAMPAEPRGIVLLEHGADQRNARNTSIAQSLREDVGVGTLLIHLLSESEEALEVVDAQLLASRLVAVCDWLTSGTRTRGLPIGLFSASTAAAALIAAAERPDDVAVVVSRRAGADSGSGVLDRVRAPTLLIDDDDPAAIDLRAASWFDRHLPVFESRDEPRG